MRLMTSLELCVWRAVNNQRGLFILKACHKCKHTSFADSVPHKKEGRGHLLFPADKIKNACVQREGMGQHDPSRCNCILLIQPQVCL